MIKHKVKFLICLGCLFPTFYLYAAPSQKPTTTQSNILQQINSFNDDVAYLYDTNMEVSELQTYQDQIQQGQQIFLDIKTQLDASSYEQMSFINNYTILLSQYAELLGDHNCFEQANPYWQNSKDVYTTGQVFEDEYPSLTYNRGLNYARQSMYYRKNEDQNQRLALLKQAEDIFSNLSQKHPDHQQFYNEYLNTLLDQLNIYQGQANSFSIQKELFNKITPTYFKYLKQKQIPENYGNTIIFIQEYYQFLYINSPQQADQWLKQQNVFIENFIHNTKELNNDEVIFLAGYYAMRRNFDQAFKFLNRIDYQELDTISPQTLKTSTVFANIRFTPQFTSWLEEYEKHFNHVQSQQCNLDILEETAAVATINS